MVREQEGILTVERFINSNLSQRKFCSEYGIKRSTLRYWLERTEELADGKEVNFCELVVAGECRC